MTDRERDDAIVAELGEDALIGIFASEGGDGGDKRILVPNGDDAAAFMTSPGEATIVTTDALVESVHFDAASSPLRCVGRKLIAVNLSDIAAMGVRPRYALVSVAIPPSTPVRAVRQIAEGIHEQCAEHRTRVIGGNTARTYGPMVLTATLLGTAKAKRIVSRRGARPGDAVFVTGTLGDANGGLRLTRARSVPARSDPMFPLYSALVDPLPRVAAGRALSKSRLAHAMCDVSDGLGRDLRRLLSPVGLGARIAAGALPISEALRAFAARSGLSAEALALEGGEDYELLFTADPRSEHEIVEVLSRIATPVSRIGEVTRSPSIEVSAADGAVAALPQGFDHFGAEGSS